MDVLKDMPLTRDTVSVTTNFDAPVVDLEVILILQPLTGRNGRNICDVPVIARQTVTIDFGGEGTLNI